MSNLAAIATTWTHGTNRRFPVTFLRRQNFAKCMIRRGIVSLWRRRSIGAIIHVDYSYIMKTPYRCGCQCGTKCLDRRCAKHRGIHKERPIQSLFGECWPAGTIYISKSWNWTGFATEEFQCICHRMTHDRFWHGTN